MNFHADRTMVVAYDNKSGQRVDIKIANAKGQTVFSDKVSGVEGVRRAYQLDKLQSGDYKLIVSSRDVIKFPPLPICSEGAFFIGLIP